MYYKNAIYELNDWKRMMKKNLDQIIDSLLQPLHRGRALFVWDNTLKMRDLKGKVGEKANSQGVPLYST